MARKMETLQPLSKPNLSKVAVNIPPSPMMKNLGYGTGVSVYQLDRSSTSNTFQSPWAIKKISKHKTDNKIVAKRLCDEASILKRLHHPNIVGFRAFTKDYNGKICLAMEACCSCLGGLIETRYENGLLAFDAKHVLKVAVDMANALNYLHNTAHFMHCDIKSYNILVKGDFEICKLCDFGVALPINFDDKVQLDDPPGTFAWMAPETIKSNIVIDKSDIYSYGLVIWEMLALVPPPLLEESTILDDTKFSVDNESSCDSIDIFESDTNTSGLNFKRVGGRPELPSQGITEDYNCVLELFYSCTEEDAKLRPNASDLVLLTQKIQDTTPT